jgi:hypothetical protein
VLTTFSLGAYYIERGRPRGANHEPVGLVQTFARRSVGSAAKHLRDVVIPV